MFVDKVKIVVKAGDGGNGMIAFRREKYVSHGGPAGGDGGRGGDVKFVVDQGTRTLLDFKYKKVFRADNGINGQSKSMHGAFGEHKIIKVPPGTLVKKNNKIIADLTDDNQEFVIAKGGRGGRGNNRFANSVNPAPHIAENGEPGEEFEIELELKLLADVGIIGYPNVGKSTLISVISAAKPKIGNYPFTTITPNLGVVKGSHGNFVVADIPGLIEGAHTGSGLGHQFLRHIERTKVLVHLIDMSGYEGRDPYEDYLNINKELELYNQKLVARPQVIVGTKMDLPNSKQNLNDFKAKMDVNDVFAISSMTKEGISDLLHHVSLELERQEQLPVEEFSENDVTDFEFKEDLPFTIKVENELYIVEGPRIEKLIKMTNFDHDESVIRFANTIKKMGLEESLRELGAQNGDSVIIGNKQFELNDKPSW